ncbi:MAG TPA: hypothetical protein PKM84_02405 [Candidatus Pacearchaeota archaeon]|nr:hypothetical protein [Candidatus Pacearchaeota archaeon]
MANNVFDFLKDEKTVIVFILLVFVGLFLLKTKGPDVKIETVSSYQDITINFDLLNKPFFDDETDYVPVSLPENMQVGRDNPFAPPATNTLRLEGRAAKKAN